MECLKIVPPEIKHAWHRERDETHTVQVIGTLAKGLAAVTAASAPDVQKARSHF